MNRRLSNALDITPNLKRGWTVLIQVLEKGHAQHSRVGNDFQRIIVSDTQGTKLTTLLYSSNVRYFANTLMPYKRYYISSAIIIPNDIRYRLGTYMYSWILNNRTLVEELVEPVPPALVCPFDFTKFSDLQKHADSENLQDVRGVVLRCLPAIDHGPDTPTRRDVVIVDEEKTLMLLTLWNEFELHEGMRLSRMVDSHPLVFGIKLKVTTFNCLSLTTRGATGIMINPPVTASLQLQDWYNNNRDELQRLLEVESYKDTNLLLPYPHPEDIVPVAMANISLSRPGTAWIQGKMKLSSGQKSYWFTACANCKKSLDADLTWVVTCPSCKVETEIEPLSRFMIDICDGTGTIQATISSPDIELFMPFTAVQLKESDETGLDAHDAIQTSIESMPIISFVRSYDLTIRGQREVRFSVVKAYKPVSNCVGSATIGDVESTTTALDCHSAPGLSASNLTNKQVKPTPVHEGPSKRNKLS